MFAAGARLMEEGDTADRGPGVRSATVVAETQVRVLAMKAEDFEEFLSTHPSVTRPKPKRT